MADKTSVAHENSMKLSAGNVAASIVMGIAFGWSFEKARVYSPLAIRAQFVFARFIMLKMFMGAVAGSALCFIVLNKFFPERFDAMRSFFIKAPVDEAAETPLRKAAIGGALLGSGMALSGACPGMVIVQAGSGVPNSWLTLVGCLIGGALFGYVQVPVENALGGCTKIRPYVDKVMRTGYPMIAFGLMAMCGGIAVVLELLLAWRDELNATHGVDTDRPICQDNIFSCVAWPPSICGLFLGFCQLPAAFIATQALGTSTVYMTITAPLMAVSKQEKGQYPRWSASITGSYSWKLPFSAGSAAGALLSALSSNSLGKAEGIDGLSAVIGGIVMIFGAQLAAGCTSGHGLSGMGMAATSSFVAVPAMFGMGIVVAFIMHAGGASVGY